MKLKPLGEQTIVITGGSSGIGLATALMAARQGAQVIVIARDEKGLRKICEKIRSDGGRAMTLGARLLAALFDQISPRLFFKLAQDSDKPKRKGTRGLHEPGSSGHLYGDQGGYMRKTGLYTSAQTQPLKTVAGVGLTGMLLSG